jgi:DNA polymerase III psi subunit
VLLLALYENVRLLLVAPAGLEMPAELLQEVAVRLDVQHATLEQVLTERYIYHVGDS